MVKKKTQRAEETKKEILTAAKILFSTHGYHAVTIREIAQKAKCSHTAIYLYFKDKEALLQQLALSPLKKLLRQLETIMQESLLDNQQKLCKISRTYFHFCITHRSLYNLITMINPSRVDTKSPETELNHIRIQCFRLLQKALLNCFVLKESSASSLTYARIFFYSLHGMVSSYIESKESNEKLIKRLTPVLDDMVQVILFGIKEKLNK